MLSNAKVSKCIKTHVTKLNLIYMYKWNIGDNLRESDVVQFVQFDNQNAPVMFTIWDILCTGKFLWQDFQSLATPPTCKFDSF